MWINSYAVVTGFIALAVGEIITILLIKSVWENIEVLQKQHDYIRGDVHEIRKLVEEKKSETVQG